MFFESEQFSALIVQSWRISHASTEWETMRKELSRNTAWIEKYREKGENVCDYKDECVRLESELFKNELLCSCIHGKIML